MALYVEIIKTQSCCCCSCNRIHCCAPHRAASPPAPRATRLVHLKPFDWLTWIQQGQLLLLVAASAAPVSGATREAALSLYDCQQQNCQLRKAHWSLGPTTSAVRGKADGVGVRGAPYFLWNIGKTRRSAIYSIVLDEGNSTNVGASEFTHRFTFHLLIREWKKEEKSKEREKGR